jgi:hypothetical protein
MFIANSTPLNIPIKTREILYKFYWLKKVLKKHIKK